MEISLSSDKHPVNFDKWGLFNFLDKTTIDSIKLACVFGERADEALFITKNDDVYGIGNNEASVLGTGDAECCLKPKRIANLCGKKIKDIAYGMQHVMALCEDGTVFNWGDNTYFQLGSRNPEDIKYPTVISTLFDKKVVKISCGWYYNLALCYDGSLYHWGCINAEEKSSPRPNCNFETKITENLQTKTVVSVACGADSAFALLATGEVYAWGNNKYGELGIASTTKTMSPTKISTLSGLIIVKIAAGKNHVLALSDEGIVYGWGSNQFGQVGKVVPNTTNVSTPAEISCICENKEKKIVDIAASHYCNISGAVDVNNNVYVWGYCRGQKVMNPYLTPFTSLHDIFALCADPPITYIPVAIKSTHKSLVSQFISHAFNDEKTSDLTIAVEDKLIHVHKTILKIRSPYFDKMFQDGWKENEDCIVHVKENTYAAYKALLEYFYTDNINVSFDAAFELLDLSRAYCEEELRERVEFLIKNSINVENASSSYVASHHLQHIELENFCLEFIMNHFTDATLSNDFIELDGSMAKEIIRKAALRRSIFKT